jgi:glycosyltransferase involved in cell wall biosynthesis
VLHVAASLSPEWGGPVKVIQGLTESLVKRGVEISIFAPSKNPKKAIIPKGVDVKLFPESIFAKVWRNHSFQLPKALKKEAERFDIVHIHELWHHSHLVAYRVAKSLGIPFVVSIHGALEPWGLSFKKCKKRIYSSLIQRRILREASALHAITTREVESIKNFKVSNRIVVIENGVDLSEFQNLPPKQRLVEYFPELRNKEIILFLGRLHINKGLDILVRAFRRVVEKYPNARLLLVGPDENGYKEQIIKLIYEGNIAEKVILTGLLVGEKKHSALSGADLFVLPSYSEGFSVSILEAMASGLPVVITKPCNFPEVGEQNAGIVINPNVDELEEAISKLLADIEIRRKMGENGKKLIMEKYNWEAISDRMLNLYKDVLDRK